MKKFIPILIAFALLSCSYRIIVNFFINQYEIEYSVVGKDNYFDIKEVYYSKDNYDFTIKDKNDYNYILSDKYNFNKQKGVIKDIAYYEDKDIMCILPIYKRDKIGNISCYYDNSQVDYAYLITNGISTERMIEKFKKYGYTMDKAIGLDKPTKEYSVRNGYNYVYEDNVYDGYTFIVWTYKGIFFINKNKTVEKDYLDSDLYDNSNSRIVGKYYLIFRFNNSTKSTNDIYYANLEDYGKDFIFIRQGLNDNMYINGTYNNKLYVTDLKEKKEYALNPYKESFEVVGQDDQFVVVKNDELVNISKKDFFSSKYLFNNVYVPLIAQDFKDTEVSKSGNYYYFMKDNIFYKERNDSLGNPIRLFKYDNVVEWKVVDNDIIFISGDTLFLFSEKYGLKPIVKNKEFKFNYKNICNLYKKS